MEYAKLKPEFKTLWLAALRSGEYEQTTGQLERPWPDWSLSAYCCLGVATKILHYNCGTSQMPSLEVKKAMFESLSSSSSGSSALVDDTVQELVALNDDKKLSFPSIADFIEENL